MPSYSHRTIISPSNNTKGTTTNVIPPAQLAAGSMKHRLFPCSVPITTNTALLFCMIASTACRCLPRNSSLSILTRRSFHRLSCRSRKASWGKDGLLRLRPGRRISPSSPRAERNPNSRCLKVALHDHSAVDQSSRKRLMPSPPVPRAVVLRVLTVALAAVAFVDLIGK